MSEKARVFISCGQAKGTAEITIADQIADKLVEMGFERPYIAVEEQRLDGVKENIFKRLANSEYFLFIDFKRERLYKETSFWFLKRFKDAKEHRGSLFSHQELAIATFLGHEVIAFQEDGSKKDDGILRFIQANCKTFSDRNQLPRIIAEEIGKNNWNPNWRNEIELEQDAFVDANTTSGLSRFYHIKVRNKHKDKTALNCVAFVERIRNLQTGNEMIPESVELKWKGVTRTEVHVISKSFRFLDAFRVDHLRPSVAIIGINPFIVDYSGYTDYVISTVGDHEIDYVVFSDNFPPARAKFKLHLGTNLTDVTFQKL